MSNNIFYNIEQRLSDPFTAIDIFNPAAGIYLGRNKFLKDIKQQFPTAEGYLKDFYLSNGVEEIYVYLKKRNGKNAFKQREQAIAIKFKQAQAEQASQEPTAAMPIQNNVQPTQTPSYYGMAGADILGMHSRAERLQDAQRLLEKIEAENEKLKTANEKLKEDKDELKYKNRELEFDLRKEKDEVDRLENKLEDKDRPFWSDEAVAKAGATATEMLGIFVAAKSRGVGMAAPEQQAQQAIIVSEPKQKLINTISLEEIEDEMANETNIVLMGIYGNPEFTEELRELLVKHNLAI